MYKKSNSFVYKFVVNCHVFGRISSGCTLWSWKMTWMITSTILFETGITKPCTQLHPAPPSSFQPPLNSIHLHQAHFSLYPALCNTLNNIWTKILHVIGQFPQILTKNWHTWYFGGVDSESRLRFLKFQPQNPFLGKFGPKNSNFSVLFENRCK